MSKWDACLRESSLFHFPLCCFSAEAAMLLWHRLLLVGELKAWDCVVTSGRFSEVKSSFYFPLNPQNVASHWFSMIPAILFAIPSSSLFKPGWQSFVSNIHKVLSLLREWSNSFRVCYKQSFFHYCFSSSSSFSLFCGPLFPNSIYSIYFPPPCLSLRDSEFSTVSKFLLSLLPPAFLTFTFAPLCLCSLPPPLPSFHIPRCVHPEHPCSSSVSVRSKICQNLWVSIFRQRSPFRCSESHWLGEKKKTETQKEKRGNKLCLHSIA